MVWTTYIARLSEVVCDLDDRAAAAALYEDLLPVAGQTNVIMGIIACEGSWAHWCGLLAACLGHWDDAEHHFVDALAMNERLGARPYVVRTRRAWASMLLDRGAPGDRERAAELIAAGHTEAEQLGMAREVVRFQRLRDRMSCPILSMNPRKLLRRLAEGRLRTISSADIRKLVEGFGFRPSRISGSHHIFTHPNVPEVVNLQDVRGGAKPYQAVLAPGRVP